MTDGQVWWETFREKGGVWVLAQFILFALIALAPVWSSRPMATLPILLHVIGWFLLGFGLVCVALSAQVLGSVLTPYPRPVEAGALRVNGIYGLVRHPMYLGVMSLALSWVLLRQSALGMLLMPVLLVFFDRKAAREEIWLQEKYPEYADYRARVRKLLPGIY